MNESHHARVSWDDCFCKIELDLLVRMARRHFVESVPTVELLRQCADETEQRAVTAVSMLDLPDEELVSQCRIGEDDCGHMLECASNVRRQLATQGILTPAAAQHST
jgi:hypothetical protein